MHQILGRTWEYSLIAFALLAVLSSEVFAGLRPKSIEVCRAELNKIPMTPEAVREELCEYAFKSIRGISVGGCFADLRAQSVVKKDADATNVCRYLAGFKDHVEEGQDSCMTDALSFRTKQKRKAIYAIDDIIPGSSSTRVVESEESVAAKFCINKPSVVKCALGLAQDAFQTKDRPGVDPSLDLLDAVWGPIPIDFYYDANDQKRLIYVHADDYPYMALAFAIGLCNRGQ